MSTDVIQEFTRSVSARVRCDGERWESNLDAKNARSLCNRAAARVDNGEIDAAIADLSEAIRLDPPSAAEPYCIRGLAYVKAGDFDIATADCTEAIRLDPESAKAYCYRGLARLGDRRRRGGCRLHGGHPTRPKMHPGVPNPRLGVRA